MSLKLFVKSLCPPFFLHLIKNLWTSYPLFSSYEDALTGCHTGYYREDLTKIVALKTQSLIKKNKLINEDIALSNLRYLFPFSLVESSARQISVLDYGGACGYHYFVANTCLSSRFKFQWSVVETPSMVQNARPMGTDELSFFQSLQEVLDKNIEADLIFTSSALQYTVSPLSSLRDLTELGAKYIYITRTPFLDEGEQIITIQRSMLSHNGPGPLPRGIKDNIVQYPVTYVPRKAVEQIIGKSYRVIARIDEGNEGFYFPGRSISVVGYMCERIV